ncbi:hypothetical protein [Actinoplanes sp. NPDC026670]|uniref:hypothetical protein n=1 Tax=Actinoplanes sp. NPDC026670 TaxID=3154700 RepID=UPI00340B3406
MSTISGYDYEVPTEAKLVAALGAAAGSDIARALVSLAARKLNKGHLRTPDDVIRATEVLMELGDQLRVTARSEKIRAVTYRALRATVD